MPFRDPGKAAPCPGMRERTRRGRAVTRLAGRPPVLMYHGVGRVGEDPFGLFVSTERFAQQMKALSLLGLRGVSLGQLGDAVARREAHGLVGLTFDDGYSEVLSSAVPILEQHGFTATIFAVPSLLGGENVWDPPPRRRLMNAAELRDLAARDWEVGAHSLTHARLSDLDIDQLRHEVFGSRTALAEITGQAPRSFCYPYGSVDVRAVDAVRDAGYSYACAVWRVAGVPLHLASPRVGVMEQDWGLRFVAKLLLRGR